MKTKNKRILKFLIIILGLSPITSLYSTEDFESFLIWILDNNNQSSVIEHDPIIIDDSGISMPNIIQPGAIPWEDYAYELPQIDDVTGHHWSFSAYLTRDNALKLIIIGCGVSAGYLLWKAYWKMYKNRILEQECDKVEHDIQDKTQKAQLMNVSINKFNEALNATELQKNALSTNINATNILWTSYKQTLPTFKTSCESLPEQLARIRQILPTTRTSIQAAEALVNEQQKKFEKLHNGVQDLQRRARKDLEVSSIKLHLLTNPIQEGIKQNRMILQQQRNNFQRHESALTNMHQQIQHITNEYINNHTMASDIKTVAREVIDQVLQASSQDV